VLRRLLLRWRAAAEARAVARRAIPDDLWQRTLNRYPFLKLRDAADQAELRRLTSLFLDRKEFSATGGLKLRNDVVVAVAAQACLPVLRSGLAGYDSFVGIVLHPDAVRRRREVTDEQGVVHEYDEEALGEAMDGGPLMLSWRDVRTAGHRQTQVVNVVIHEFAHVLDRAGGISTAAATRLEPERARLAQRAEAGEATVTDPYGAESGEEFFAVASEVFFANPAALKREHPDTYAFLRAVYRQDPQAEGLP
jgi:Mlc titration factor MtfA (ptsG expression regulator)